MIVVVGTPGVRSVDRTLVADGPASAIARAATAAGATVQLVGKVGDDPAGDAVLIDLARDGIGHAALLRDPANPTPAFPPTLEASGDDEGTAEPDDLLDAAHLLVEAAPPAESPAVLVATTRGPVLEPADLELGLRYLVEFRVVVTTVPLDERAASVVADAAAYAGARIVALVSAGEPVPASLLGATVLEIPPDDPDDAFSRLVAAYAVALDAGTDEAGAFRSAAESGGWESARP